MSEVLAEEQKREMKKQRELLRQSICDMVFEYKHNKNTNKAVSMIVNNNLSFEDIINTTMKLDLYHLASLADKVIYSKNEKTQ